MKNALIIGFPEYENQSAALAKAAGLAFGVARVHRFPDGESRLTLPPDLPAQVIFCRSLDHANAKLAELVIAAGGARDLGAKKLSLVAPYLCYMRQDKAFHPGEVVSQKAIGHCLAAYFDNLLTVDAHLHRISRLAEAAPVAGRAVNLNATAPMARFIQAQVDNACLIGPDQESEQWVAAIARHAALDFGVASKQRYGDRNVKVSLPDGDYRGRHMVLVDDVASTGKTLLQAARALAPYRPASVSVLVTHALFVGDAMDQLKTAGVDRIWSCDSIPHPTNAVALADILAAGLKAW